MEAIYDKLPPPEGGDKGAGDGVGKAGGQNSGSQGNPPQSAGYVPGASASAPSGPRAPGPGEVRDLPDPDRADEMESEWKMAVQQAAQSAKKRGKLPASLAWVVDDTTRSKSDWRSILHRFVQQAARNDYDWRMPNARYMHLGLYLPSLRSEAMGPMVIGVDTSGSTRGWMGLFFAELKSAVEDARPERVHVVYADAKVQKVEEYGPDDEMVLALRGGGGTDFRPFFEWIEASDVKPACAVYLTDLKGALPDVPPDYPVLWASPEQGAAPFGKVVHVEI